MPWNNWTINKLSSSKIQHWVPCSTNISGGKQRRHRVPNRCKVWTSFSFLILKKTSTNEIYVLFYPITKKRSVWGRSSGTTQTRCTQLACCRWTIRLSCLPLFPKWKQGCFWRQSAWWTEATPSPVSYLEHSKPNCAALQLLKLSRALPASPVLVLCPCHIYSLRAVGWSME